MRVLQLIDSLEIGGAETLAVNYANALSEEIAFSSLVATRKEGALKQNLNDKVVFDCLHKKSTTDVKALLRLRKFALNHKIEIVHAHGTSYFTATILKLLVPKIKIIWHEHYGARANQEKSANLILWCCSLFFKQIFVVNFQLKDWMRKNLLCRKVDYIPNFAVFPKPKKSETALYGEDGKRIVCLANLKKPKNHLFLLQAFQAVRKKMNNSGWTLHLIGNDFNDAYSDELKAFIQHNNLQNEVFIYGKKTDIEHILEEASVGILASTDEGFPVSLLEYQLAGIPVLSTNAGYCSSIIKDEITGLLFNPTQQPQLENCLERITNETELRKKISQSIKQQPSGRFSAEKVIALLISKYNEL